MFSPFVNYIEERTPVISDGQLINREMIEALYTGWYNREIAKYLQQGFEIVDFTH